MADVFRLFIVASFSGTLLAAILAILRPISKKFFSAAWHYYIWLVVLIVMLIPVRIQLPQTSVSEVITEEKVAETDGINYGDVYEEANDTIYLPEATSDKSVTVIHSFDFDLISRLWLAVALFLFILKLAMYWIFLFKIKRNSRKIEIPEISKYINIKVETRASGKIYSPLTTGVIKPIIVLPDTALSDEQLRYILAHECTHIKRRDILYKWLVAIVKCVHWFNPFIYVISRQINLDCEISCDISVVNEDNPIDYMETIISLLSDKNCRHISLTTGMTGRKKVLAKRFRAIKSRIKTSRKRKIISVVLAVLVAMSAVGCSGVLNSKINHPVGNLTTDTVAGEEFNVLVIGTDNGNHIDTIIVFNFDGDALTAMIVPRNTKFITENDKSLSVILSEDNGDQKVIDTVKAALGIPINYYARINIKAVEDIIDLAGGIELEIPENMIYDDPAQNLYINLSAGRQRLTGEQVGHLLRYRDRKAPNDIEIRQMNWRTVIKEFVAQTVIGGDIKDFRKAFDVVSGNIVTNYPAEKFTEDISVLCRIDRNNIVTERIRGRNVAINGYFEFHINYAESAEILSIFGSEKTAEEHISVVTYKDEEMGFEIKLPENWKSRYDAIKFDNQVVFYHKDIFQKYGKGSGQLFSITRDSPPLNKEFEENTIPHDTLYWSKEYAYIWAEPTDIQYPVWVDRDAEDEVLSKDYRNMQKDLEFIKNSFSLTEQPIRQTSKKNNVSDIPRRKNTAKIKSENVSDIPYGGFEHITIENADSKRIQEELAGAGINEAASEKADLSREYIVNTYNEDEKINRVMCDKNGNISVYFDINSDNLTKVSIMDAVTNEVVGEYGVLANNGNAYTFLGFELGKEYIVDVQSKTNDEWNIQGEYIIY